MTASHPRCWSLFRVPGTTEPADMQALDAGQLIFRLNEEALSRTDPRLRRIKTCLDQAAQVVFDGQATVQIKGSVGKGTSTTFSADMDTFVRHVGVVTEKQRSQFAQQVLVNFERSSITSRAQLHERRIRFYEVSVDGQSAPDVDVVFNYYKDIESGLPDNRKFADSPLAQQAVRYIKRLPSMYTNLNQPKGVFLEDFVLAVGKTMNKDRFYNGKAFLSALLERTLSCIVEYHTYGAALGDAQMSSQQWRDVATEVRRFWQQHRGWPRKPL